MSSVCVEGVYLASVISCVYSAGIYLTSVMSCVYVAGVYLTSVMALTSMSVVLAVVVSSISSRGRKDNVMPRRFKSCIITLARLLRFRLHYITPDITAGRDMTQHSRSRPDVLYKGVMNQVSTDSGFGLVELETNVDFQPTARGGAGQSSSAAALRAEFRRSRRDEGSSGCPGADSAADSDPPTSCSDMEDILKRLREVLVREEERDRGENLCRQWHEAAEVIDRFLFWVFVLGTVLATITSLIVLPLAKKPLDPSLDIYGA